MRQAIMLAALLGIPAAAAADEVRLRNGGRIVGIVREEGDRVVVEVNIGTVSFSKTEVAEIRYDRTPLHEYQERRAAIEGSREASDYYDLALWAKSKELTRYVNPLLEQVIAIEPNHAGGRALLGYVFYENCWMTKTEHLKALGFVEFRGRLVKPEERDAVLAREAAARAEEEAAQERRRQERADIVEELRRLEAFARIEAESRYVSPANRMGLAIGPQLWLVGRCHTLRNVRHPRNGCALPMRPRVAVPDGRRERSGAPSQRDAALPEDRSLPEMEGGDVPAELPARPGLLPSPDSCR